MRMRFRQFCSILTPILLISCFLWNCGDQPAEKSKPPVISKKISIPDKPASSEPENQSLQAEERVEPAPKAADEKEASASKRIYDPTKRLDPFVPLYRAEQEKPTLDQMDKSKRKKRIPQTPLERISIEQLQLRAVIRASSGNRALVEDSSGKGYIIKNGTYIGLNSGIVAQITPDSVIVEEEIENLMGELVLQNTEIKLQKPAGE